MKLSFASCFSPLLLLATIMTGASGTRPFPDSQTQPIFGFRNSATENSIERLFLAVPDPKLAEEHLRILTQAPHMAGTVEDKATAEYVAKKFREAGLETEIDRKSVV